MHVVVPLSSIFTPQTNLTPTLALTSKGRNQKHDQRISSSGRHISILLFSAHIRMYQHIPFASRLSAPKSLECSCWACSVCQECLSLIRASALVDRVNRWLRQLPLEAQSESSVPFSTSTKKVLVSASICGTSPSTLLQRRSSLGVSSRRQLDPSATDIV